ncbi:orotidine-5'-phosphate decarboxylase [Acidisphaera sp. L21]|uniref:orotidine-5'-phosphate decarboxylase n=1 Tax=Acidisphaera sp. L21 TaxID=1641851 RepID=UPI00131AAA1F|nr:orotidine-5'-phosphate decarboxylase [Acidisphaera sp. L21]
MTSDISHRLIVALDVPTPDDARRTVAALDGAVSFFKLGYWLLFQPGASGLIDELQRDGRQLFLDYKMYDISETVRHGVASVAQRGARFVTVHGDRPILRAAVDGAAGSSLGVLAVTVLTSLDDAALHAMGYAHGAREMVERRTRDAAEAGCAGVIASAADDPDALRRASGRDDLLVVTPGIRMPSDDVGDQVRTATPGDAIARGADYLVVGRPIVQAAAPLDAARRVIDDMEAGRVRRG